MYVFFKDAITLKKRFIEMEGVDPTNVNISFDNLPCGAIKINYDLKNCYVIENKNLPGHYYIQANEVEPLNKSLENLIYNPEIDPFKCSSTNIDTCLELFGCCEANSRHILECVYTSKNISATSSGIYSNFNISFASV